MLVRLMVASLVLSGLSSAMGIWVRNINGEWVRPSWEKRANPGDVLRLPLTNKGDRSYSTPVLMGTPAQPIEMSVSLSQNHILVASSANQGAAGYYEPSTSSSYQAGSETVDVSNPGGQSLQATFSQEVCDVAEFSYNANVAITAPTVTDSLYPEGVYGVLGYGIDAKPSVPANSTLLGIYLPPNLTSTEAVCGIELNREEPGVPGGTFTMGGRDNTAYSGDFTVVTVADTLAAPGRPSWTIPIEEINAEVAGSVSNNGDPYQAGVLQGGFASIDPYYPFISIPTRHANTLYDVIPGAHITPETTPNSGLGVGNCRYAVPCNTTITLTLRFGGKAFKMDPKDAVVREGDTCFGTIEANDQHVYRIGSPFMRNVYTTFGAIFDAADSTPTGSETSTGTASAPGSTDTTTNRNTNASTGGALQNAPSFFTLLFGAAFFLL
ncbi:acid protease [Serendipita vermifera]|nr:acid protease [Serendipita vermifera]